EPIASMRLKMLRQGAQDAALWSLLDSVDARAARRVAEEIVPRALGDRVPMRGRGLWLRDMRVYERAREAMIDRVLAAGTPGASDAPSEKALIVRRTAQALLVALLLAIAVARWARGNIQ